MRLKIGSTYQKAVTIIEKLKEGNASIFICGKAEPVRPPFLPISL